jgi:CRP-like cAMP-binding protein
MKEILNYLSQTYWKITEDVMTYILQKCDEVSIPKGEILLEEGKVCRHVWFIKKGMLRAYQESPAEDGETAKVFTNWFMKERDIATSVDSFFDELPSVEEIVAVEDTVAFRMSSKDLFAGMERYPCMNMLTTRIIIMYYRNSYFFQKYLRMKTPQVIYQWMLSVCPEILQRASQKDLASFLGVSEPVYREIKSGKYKQKPR